MNKLIDSLKNRRHKNNKPLYYLRSYIRYYFFSSNHANKLNRILKRTRNYDSAYLKYRVDYYNKLSIPTPLPEDAPTLNDFVFPENLKTYFLDALQFTRFFPKNNKFLLERGDITEVPKQPSILKSRPIHGENQNSVLLKLNYIRHFIYIKNDIPFHKKKDVLVWRGNILSHQKLRARFFEQHFNNERCNIGLVNNVDLPDEWKKEKLSLNEQLQNKFILSLEGNDVATNLKWVMSSNSIAVMPTPKFETWFMEGTLIPDHHYIHIKDDFSNLDVKLNYYLQNPDKALEIIKNAQQYLEQFKNKKRENLISLLVLDKYFKITN